jgi:hypothetical protein
VHVRARGTRAGYVKKPKISKFLRRFSREHRDFFGDSAWGGGQVQDPPKSFEDNGFYEEEVGT